MKTFKFIQNHNLFSSKYLNDIQPKNLSDELNALQQTLKEWLDQANFDNFDSALNSFIIQVLNTLQFAHSPIDGTHIEKLYADWSSQKPIGLCFPLAPDKDLDCTDKGCHYAEKMIRSLREHDLNWGILTDGKLWRLYRASDATPYESYLEINLPAALGDAGCPTSSFEIFSVLFSPSAFNFVSDDTQKLDQMKKESDETTEAVEKHIKESIENILGMIARGFVEYEDKERFTEQEREEIFQSSICLLFRIMFILYAEARNLLPMDNPDYRVQSLENLIEQAFSAHTEGLDNPQSNSMYSALRKLFNDIDGGDGDLGIEPYNGGLFDTQQHPYLSEHKINNAYLTEALFYLAFYEAPKKNKEPEKISYRGLSVRNLGAVYEGVLEYNLFLADEPMVARPSKRGFRFLTEKDAGRLKKGDKQIPVGDIYFADDPTVRKETGSYYTPEYIVDYIVKNTVVTKLEELKSDFKAERERWLVDLDAAIDSAERERIQNFIDSETLRFINEKILSLKVLDPAMGSGHFLVNAINAITNFIVELLNDTDWENPDISTDPQVWRRHVVEHCICGVDINPLAVELAKLSLWIISTQKDKPLTFLNHHLKPGNSLVGAKVDDLGGLPESAKQLSIYFRRNFIDSVKQSIAKISELERRATDDLKDIDRKKELWEDAHQQLEPFRQIANLWVELGYFDDSLDDDEKDLIYSKALDSMSKMANFRKPDTQHVTRNTFHWELEFPEVFFELETGEPQEDAGFDCVIGNPPYVDVAEDNFTIDNYRTTKCRNLYSYMFETSLENTCVDGRFGLIVPLSLVCSKRMKSLQDFIIEQSGELYISNYAKRPAKLFPDAEQRISIAYGNKKPLYVCDVFTTRYHRWYTGDETEIFDSIEYAKCHEFKLEHSIPKLGSDIGRRILDKIFAKKKNIGNYISSDGSYILYYHNVALYWLKAYDFIPLYKKGDVISRSSTCKDLRVDSETHKNLIIALLNSSLFYWYWILYSDCFHLTLNDIENFPVELETIPESLATQIISKCHLLMEDYKQNSIEKSANYSTGRITYQEFYPRKSKSIIDEIDALLGQCYGLSDAEIEFIINYDIRFRMGKG